MSITLDVNAFLNNNEICTESGCNGIAGGEHNASSGAPSGLSTTAAELNVDDIPMEKEMESNGSIFDEIENLLKFNQNLEFLNAAAAPVTVKEDNNKQKKPEGHPKQKEAFNLDFLTHTHTDDFLLGSDTQSLFNEETLLFSVEKDQLQPLSSRFMVPGIYKRIEGVDRIENRKNLTPFANVYVTSKEKTGRIITEQEFNRLYVMTDHLEQNGQHSPKMSLSAISPSIMSPSIISSSIASPSPISPPTVPAPIISPSAISPPTVPAPIISPSAISPPTVPAPIISPSPISPPTVPAPIISPTPISSPSILPPTIPPPAIPPPITSLPIILPPTTSSPNISPIVGNGYDKEIDPVPKKKTDGNGKEITKELDALQRLACDIYKLNGRDHIVIDKKRNEIVKTQYGTNQKTIYRLRHPDMMGLMPGDPNETNNRIKAFSMRVNSKAAGRPKNKQNKIEAPNATPDDALKDPNNTFIKEPIIPPTRTRSGRIVKAPQTFTQIISIKTEPSSPPSAMESISDVLADLRDESYKCSKRKLFKSEPAETEGPETVKEEDDTASPPKRKVPPEAICPTCQKIFLGKRLLRHFAQHPDHIKVPVTQPNDIGQAEEENTFPNTSTEMMDTSFSGEDTSLFRFLVNKLQKTQILNEDQKADLFLSELNDFIEQLQLRSSRIIRNTSGLHFVNPKCAKLLGIPEGQYALDMTAIEGPLEPEMHDHLHLNNHTSTSSTSRCMDYTNLSITLDSTLTDEAAQKLNLSAGGKLLPPSEETLLRAVGDLVQTDITKLQTTDLCVNNTNLPPNKPPEKMVVANSLPPHIDHVSDNAVEAGHMKETLPNVVAVHAPQNPLLDLSVDFFQFNN